MPNTIDPSAFMARYRHILSRQCVEDQNVTAAIALRAHRAFLAEATDDNHEALRQAILNYVAAKVGELDYRG